MIFPNTQYSGGGEFTPIPLAITTTSLKNAVLAYAQHTRLLAGGSSPYNWSTTSGTLPTGLTLGTNGLITGTWLDQLLLLASDEVVVLGENSTLYRRYTAEGRGAYTYSLLGTLPTGFTFSVDTLTGGTIPLDQNTKLLMHFNGTQGGIAIESQGKVLTKTGSVGVDTSRKQNNIGSFSYTTDSDSLSLAANSAWIFAGDFTLEGWYYKALTRDESLLVQTPDQLHYFALNVSSTGYTLYPTALAASAVSFPATISTSVWHHVALVRSSGVIKVYHDGVAVGSPYSNSSSQGYNQVLGIGALPGNTYSYRGNIEEIRVSSSARYTVNFIAPTTVLSDDANTLAHITPNPGFTDYKGNAISTVGSPTLDITAKYGGAAYFGGANADYLSTAYSTDFNLGDTFTIEFWYKQTTGQPEVALLTTCSGYFSESGWMIGAHLNTLNFYNCPSTSNFQIYPFGLTSQANVWYHLAVSCTAGVLRLFVNGVQTYTTTGITAGPTTRGVYLGYDGITNLTGRNLLGAMDEVHVSKGIGRYSANFTPTLQTADAYTVLLLHMDGATGSTTFTDEKSKAITTNGSVVAKNRSGFGNSSIYFNGSTDYLSITPPTGGSWQLTSSPWTIDLWFNPSSTPNNAYICGIMGSVHRWITGTGYMWLISVNSTSVSLQYYTALDAPGQIWVTTPIVNGVWRHFAAVNDGTNVKVYIDGIFGGTAPASAAAASTGLTPPVADINRPMYVAASTAYAGRWFNGYIDELRFSNTARWTSSFTPPVAAYLS